MCKRKVIPRPPGRRPRRNSDSSESSDSDTAGDAAQNERTPLLPPPAGRAEDRLGAVGGAPSSYGSGMSARFNFTTQVVLRLFPVVNINVANFAFSLVLPIPVYLITF